MTDTATEPDRRAATGLNFDVIIVGAGISGLYQLHLLRQLGLRVRVLEAGTGVGGVWYWNRYPGARFDSESWSYGYSFCPETLAEWDWTEHFAPQPETERYLNRIADRYDLRRDISFRSRVRVARWLDEARAWEVTVEDGSVHRTRFLITCIGPLSAPTWPRFEGIDDFEGESCHTGLWPKHDVDFRGKRVAVIGAGATGVQTIQEVAKTAGHLAVFQRRPNWCTPLHNGPIDAAEMAAIRARYPQIFELCRTTNACFVHTTDPRGTFEVSEAERTAFWEQLYDTPGFAIWQGNFRDVLVDREANRLLSEFVAGKIRQRVNDPETAEKLIPRDHGFGTRRVPQETHYYEVYNQPNVRLVSMLETPIERITKHGLRTTEEEFEFDIIIYATGFDAVTGSFDRIDITGAGGLPLRERWAAGPETLMGLMVDGFPNMMMVIGPHQAMGNIPRSIEFAAELVRDMIAHLAAHGITRAEARPEAVAEWMAHAHHKAEGLLSSEIESWMTGVNMNVDGRQVRRLVRYSGSAPEYRAWCRRMAEGGYAELLTR
jgi:cation diffusion facilitator CzcD-associated flavoprotein CzcO